MYLPGTALRYLLAVVHTTHKHQIYLRHDLHQWGTHLKGVEDRRKVLVELDIHHGTDNLGYASHAAGVHSRRGMEARATC